MSEEVLLESSRVMASSGCDAQFGDRCAQVCSLNDFGPLVCYFACRRSSFNEEPSGWPLPPLLLHPELLIVPPVPGDRMSLRMGYPGPPRNVR